MCGCLSPQGKWAYCGGEDGKVRWASAWHQHVNGSRRSLSESKLYWKHTVCITSPSPVHQCSPDTPPQVYVFDLSHAEGAQLEHIVKVAEKELVGLCHHPHRNLLATHAADGLLRMWKP